MKKRIYIIITTLFLLLASAANAQVFTMADEENSRAEGDLDVLGRIPYHGVDYDQANDFAPLGEGMLLLTALGGCYLLGKRRKDDEC